MWNSIENQDDDDEGPIYDEVKLTAYDRRRIELRKLEDERDTITAQAEITDTDRARLAKLAPLIKRAQEKFDREGDRAKDDKYRQRHAIDKWRAGEGRDDYNAKRRKVRDRANTDLKHMTAEKKAQYERDRRSDANWFKRQRAKGRSEAAITAAYMERLRLREEERSVDDELRNHPNFGMMGNGK